MANTAKKYLQHTNAKIYFKRRYLLISFFQNQTNQRQAEKMGNSSKKKISVQNHKGLDLGRHARLITPHA